MTTTTEISAQDLSLQAIDGKASILLINAIRNGLDYSFFDDLLKTIPFSFADWSNYLNLSERTLQRYKKEHKPFQANFAERVLEIRLLYNYGVKVFEDIENFNTWLTTISVALGGVKPKDLLDTTFGINLVRDELTRIEHGVLA